MTTQRLTQQVRDRNDANVLAQLRAVRAVLAERERELLDLKGPCSLETCRLHYAHAGPCDPR